MRRYRIALYALLGWLLATGALASGSADRLVEQGNTHWLNNQLDLAEAQYRLAIEADPESLAAHTQLASLHLARNRNQEAVEAYQSAIILDPSNASLFVGICLAYLHQGHFSRSHAMCSQALRLDPELENARKLQAYIDAKVAAQQAAETTGGAPPPATAVHSAK